jgi:hypothetical protein
MLAMPKHVVAASFILIVAQKLIQILFERVEHGQR